MSISTALSETKSGRILLHLTCLLRRPGHAAWHWHGITREISFGSIHLIPRMSSVLPHAVVLLVMVFASIWVAPGPRMFLPAATRSH